MGYIQVICAYQGYILHSKFVLRLQSDFNLDPEGKIFKDIWNMGTNYMENKFYFYEMNGSETNFICFGFYCEFDACGLFCFFYYHKRLKFCAFVHFCESNSVSLLVINIISIKGFEGYKINPFVLKPTTAIKTRRKCFKYPYPNKAGLFEGCLFCWFDLTPTPLPPLIIFQKELI